jgi:hypothetical protein
VAQRDISDVKTEGDIRQQTTRPRHRAYALIAVVAGINKFPRITLPTHARTGASLEQLMQNSKVLAGGQ